MTDPELDALVQEISKLAWHKADVAAAAITTMRADIAALTSDLASVRAAYVAESDAHEVTKAALAAQIEADAGVETCGDCMGSGWGGHPDSGCYCESCLGLGAVFSEPSTQPHDRTALDAMLRAAEEKALREAAQAAHDATTHASAYACKAAILALIPHADRAKGGE